MSDHDQRQYRLMLDSLEAFQVGTLKMEYLIGNLSALLLALESGDKIWKESFQSDWAILEQAHALAHFRGSNTLNEHEMGVARDAAERLKALVLEKGDG